MTISSVTYTLELIINLITLLNKCINNVLYGIYNFVIVQFLRGFKYFLIYVLIMYTIFEVIAIGIILYIKWLWYYIVLDD